MPVPKLRRPPAGRGRRTPDSREHGDIVTVTVDGLRHWPLRPRTARTAPIRRAYWRLSMLLVPSDEGSSLGVYPFRIIQHECGAMLPVPSTEQLASEETWVHFPNLRAVLSAARDAGVDWVDLDSFGHDLVDGLPVFDWDPTRPSLTGYDG